MLRPVPSNWQISIFIFFFVLTLRFSVFHMLNSINPSKYCVKVHVQHVDKEPASLQSFFFYKSNFDPNMHNSTDCALNLNRGQSVTSLSARPMSSNRLLFLLRPAYMCNEPRCLNQLCDAFGEIWGHFHDAGGFSPEFLKSAYFGGLVPPLYRWNEYSWSVFLLEGCRSA